MARCHESRNRRRSRRLRVAKKQYPLFPDEVGRKPCRALTDHCESNMVVCLLHADVARIWTRHVAVSDELDCFLSDGFVQSSSIDGLVPKTNVVRDLRD